MQHPPRCGSGLLNRGRSGVLPRSMSCAPLLWHRPGRAFICSWVWVWPLVARLLGHLAIYVSDTPSGAEILQVLLLTPHLDEGRDLCPRLGQHAPFAAPGSPLHAPWGSAMISRCQVLAAVGWLEGQLPAISAFPCVCSFRRCRGRGTVLMHRVLRSMDGMASRAPVDFLEAPFFPTKLPVPQPHMPSSKIAISEEALFLVE